MFNATFPKDTSCFVGWLKEGYAYCMEGVYFIPGDEHLRVIPNQYQLQTTKEIEVLSFIEMWSTFA